MLSNIRKSITEKILRSKVQQNLKWSEIAEKIGRSKEWTATACLGDACFDKNEAEKIGKLFNLNEEDIKWLQVVPNRNITADAELAKDPVMSRLKEVKYKLN
uniref:HTH cro/C1-type domain-containing protein n=1 Tax=Panagrolaimus sp. PS1159 TaxID=55785 RepID=A0AC35FN00_9BILA